MSSCKWRNFELKFLTYVGLGVLKIFWKFQCKRMFPSHDNQFSRKLDFLTVLWNMSISCNRIIFRRKHPFALKFLGYSKKHEAYIWQKFQLEIPSFARGHCCWILGFSKSKRKPKIQKSKKNSKIRNPPFPPWGHLGRIYRQKKVNRNLWNTLKLAQFSTLISNMLLVLSQIVILVTKIC